ncbi:GDSL-type esterase/lipase family protein [Pedobacter sp. SL55]|uniref:GDSL-type esterase/lipase family protein n=1 Tax=Pedobacter sp. SL55 TaxID=2995161 RepID=UPI0022708E87|nr:GDSL-type esterase/lipase family protein [Pedobacter sp. SL55]WAC41765.1 GDSL-type esterase/lipase family protein [Pedobacter sp. SL55]
MEQHSLYSPQEQKSTRHCKEERRSNPTTMGYFSRFKIASCLAMTASLIIVIAFLNTAKAQTVKIDSNYANWYYQQRMEYFAKTPIPQNAIIFLGNSITERAEWQELLADSKYPIVNRGIGGDNSFGILARMDEIVAAKPKAVYLMDGINDQFRKLPHDVSVYNYKRIIRKIKQQSPKTKIYVESCLPINESMTKEAYTKDRNVLVPALNQKIKALAEAEGVTYIDICPIFQDDKGVLKQEFTIDGVHLKAAAYIDWVKFLKDKTEL